MSKLSISDIVTSGEINSDISVERKMLDAVRGGITVETCNPSSITTKPDGTVIITCK